CLYLGTDPNGDPVLSKGLLGASPADITGTSCQFIVEAEAIDFVSTALRGAPWLTSSNNLYYLNIKAIDVSGNVFTGSSAQFSFKFDNTPPQNITYFSLPSYFVATKDVTWTWPTTGGDAASDANSGLAGLQYRIGQAGTWYGDTHTGTEDDSDLLTNDGSYTTSVDYDYPVLNEGSNFIYIRSWDNAGNISSGFVSGVLKINTISPSPPLSLVVDPIDNSVNAYAFQWSSPASFIGQEENLTYCYTVNTLPSLSTCNYTAAGVTSLDADAYANQPGLNTFYLVARDEASNINYDTYTTVQFTYSGTAPGIPTNPDVADISIKATANWRLALSWETPTNIGAGISSYQIFRSTTNPTCTDNFAAFSLISTVGTSTYYADTGLTQQNYYYCIKACDSANNCSATSATVTGYPDGKFTEPAGLLSGPKVSG
ncbi:hypothetical protein KC640_03405, partial [Candidatus Dojkabacteria bacterium]|nr:hypothetical protein [Candidatus Dojkabacteria bacterium]